MPTIFIGLLALALVLWLAKSFARVDPKYMIRVGRTAGGIVALAGAAFLGACFVICVGVVGTRSERLVENPFYMLALPVAAAIAVIVFMVRSISSFVMLPLSAYL